MARIEYAKTSDGAHVAYSVVGDGPLDLVFTGGYTISIDSYDDEPHSAHMWRRLASFCRLIRFDMRGIGLSDPFDPSSPPTIEDTVDHLVAVVDAVGAAQVCVLAISGAATTAIELAATRPDRVSSLVLVNAAARYLESDDYPYGYSKEFIDSFLSTNMDPSAHWTLDDAAELDDLALMVPSLKNDVRFREWWTRASQRGASPAMARAIVRRAVSSDLRSRLAEISAPTLVLHAGRNLFTPVELGRYLGDHIPNAKYLEIASSDDAMWGLDADLFVDQIEEFVTGRRGSGGERVLATVLFSDIVASTERVAAVGDRAWRALLDTHDTIVRSELARYGGDEVNTTGDGFVASFTSPTQAVRCARAIVDAAEGAQVPVRIGIHTGEVERRGKDLAGLAVHIAARVGARAAPGEVLTSRTVRDLVAGSGLRFADRGEHDLKGVPDAWQLFALEP